MARPLSTQYSAGKRQRQELAPVLLGGIAHGGVDAVHDVGPHIGAHEGFAQLVLVVLGLLPLGESLAQLRHLGLLGDLAQIVRPKWCVAHSLPPLLLSYPPR